MTVEAENVGGIDRTTVSLEPGVTVLAGRNATNRTSLLQALMAAIGSGRASLKADAEKGTVTLRYADETYTRTLRRTEDGSVATGGDPYLTDPTEADLFAFLLESNEARRAVVRQEDLRDVIMRPIDTESIQVEIEQLEHRKREVDRSIEKLSDIESRLSELESERSRLETVIGEKQDALEAKEAEIDDTDVAVDESREEQRKLESKMQSLRDTRSELDDVRFDVETESESIETLEADIESYEEKLDGLPETSEERISEIENEIEHLRGRERELSSTLSQLQSVVQFNEQTLEDEQLPSAFDDAEGSPTDELVQDETLTCWTCGSSVGLNQVEETLDRLRDLRREKHASQTEIREQIDELTEQKSELSSTRSERARTEERLDAAREELDRRRDRVTELESTADDLREKLTSLEADVESLQDREYDDILELHREANELEFEIERRQSELDEVKSDIEATEGQRDEREELKAEREEIADRLTDMRTRIDRVEAEAVDSFNTHMETVLDRLGYENLDRIWIERRERTVREGRRTVEKSHFELHIVRSSESGTAYEDTIDHLSESEREVTGLVFALAGYLTHETYETVPFMLLDSLEAIDSERIASLVDYLADFAENIVVALLPEDAAALDGEYHRVTEI